MFSKISFLVISFVSTGVLLSGCDSSESILHNPVVDPEILPAQGVAGINFGDSQKEVEAKLGEFALGGIADGFFRSWYSVNFFGAGNSSSDGLIIYFAEVWDSVSNQFQVGPVDAFLIKPPYDGMTRHGIGIGSTKEEVITAFGEPSHEYDFQVYGEGGKPKTVTSMRYCFGFAKRFGISLIENEITTISMGYYFPPPEDYLLCE